jgi:uncharacterized membrane protein
MKTVKFGVEYKDKASRLELFIRIIYAIPLAIVVWILSFIMSFVNLVQWFHILILGRRHKSLYKFAKLYLGYVTKISAYIWLLVDERPEIIPDEDG